jgi:DNA-3-methyladenine glycosylase II
VSAAVGGASAFGIVRCARSDSATNTAEPPVHPGPDHTQPPEAVRKGLMAGASSSSPTPTARSRSISMGGSCRAHGRCRHNLRLEYPDHFCNACVVTATRTGKRATEEQRAASKYLGSLDDSLAPRVRSTGPIDAYEMHLPVKVRGPLEWFAFAITSRQLSRAAAAAIYNRLLAQLGGSITAERVIATDEQTMRGVGLSHPKTRAIRGLAELADDGLLEPDKLAAMSDAEIHTELVAVPGIGPSSAQMFMMRYLHRPDIFPAGDLGVRAAVTELDRLDTRITPKAVEQRSELWRPYRSYATAYLWGYTWELHHPAAG